MGHTNEISVMNVNHVPVTAHLFRLYCIQCYLCLMATAWPCCIQIDIVHMQIEWVNAEMHRNSALSTSIERETGSQNELNEKCVFGTRSALKGKLFYYFHTKQKVFSISYYFNIKQGFRNKNKATIYFFLINEFDKINF